MKIIRSMNNVSGSVTVASGDIVASTGAVEVTDMNKGVILTNQDGERKLITVDKDEGVDVLKIQDAP